MSHRIRFFDFQKPKHPAHEDKKGKHKQYKNKEKEESEQEYKQDVEQRPKKGKGKAPNKVQQQIGYVEKKGQAYGQEEEGEQYPEQR